MLGTGVYTCSVDPTQELFFPFKQLIKWWLSGFSSCWQHQYKTHIVLNRRCFVKENKDTFFTLTVTALAGPQPESLMWGWLVGTGWEWGDHQASARTREICQQKKKVTQPISSIYTSKTDWQSIVPYWEYKIFFVFFCHDLTKYHSVANKD